MNDKFGKCGYHPTPTPAPVHYNVTSATTLMVAFTRPQTPIYIKAHGPKGWNSYTGSLLSIEHEDGSGKSFNIVLNDSSGQSIKLYVRF